MTAYYGPNSPEAFLSLSEVFPSDGTQFLGKLNSVYTDIARNVNAREISRYELTETITGKQFFDPANAQNRRFGYRKCFDIGAIAPGAILSFAHGITNLTLLTKAYGTFTTATTFGPIPYASAAAANQSVELLINATNIQVINGAAGPNITSGLVVLEYLKN